ncbi:NAD(P) transhydrogenase subunit alpha [Membranicola marinus]|uniref:proton-translocating NAD(P)(+) transhydrogenase n=1 Tax=Membranihabitans marinus TaxID=1227546 RepID=A0A953LB45_9BACT|nr:NAD(P) transhydrogenase subunit alpha [Membranihabitans marinus]MBY5959368.1 NAD(P) transhydrogenase subunit alpha [Membranihabitans marinus]
MKLGILRTPARTILPISQKVIKKLSDLGAEVVIEKPESSVNWEESLIQNSAPYVSREEILKTADILLSVGYSELESVNARYWISEFQPFNQPDITGKLDAMGITGLSLDMIPRISRAQSMDVLSSMASIAGYKAVLQAADLLPRYFPMMITAAGSIRPARVLVIGAGVAGLQAIATARRLGGVVEAFDTRSAVKEEVESLGGKFVEVEGATDRSDSGGYAVEQSEDYKKRQQEKLAERASGADVIITTAQLRGKPAPKIITEEVISNMPPGAVIVDLAASTGGNTIYTENNKLVAIEGISIIGDSYLADSMPQTASELYANNAFNFMELIVKEKEIQLDLDDEIISNAKING